VITSKLGQHEGKTLRMLNCEQIFDISNGLTVALQQIYDEIRETGSLITFAYID